MRLALHAPVPFSQFDTGWAGKTWHEYRPLVRTAALIGVSVLAAPVTLVWLAYGAWLTARDIDRDGAL